MSTIDTLTTTAQHPHAPIITGGPERPGETAAQRGAVYQAAANYGVSADVLWAIYGAESSYGKAPNSFGLVAVPRTGSFAGDANASARTLRKLLDANNGNYEAALRKYSGNSYGLSHLADVLKSDPTKVAFPKTFGKYDTDPFPDSAFAGPSQVPLVGPAIDAVGGVGNAVSSVGNAASDVGGAIANVWNALTAPKTWLRVLFFVGGLAVAYFALQQLSVAARDGQAPPPSPVGNTVKRVATAAATRGVG